MSKSIPKFFEFNSLVLSQAPVQVAQGHDAVVKEFTEMYNYVLRVADGSLEGRAIGGGTGGWQVARSSARSEALQLGVPVWFTLYRGSEEQSEGIASAPIQ